MTSVAGSSLRLRRPLDAVRAGIAMLPESRKDQGLLMRRPIRENIALPHLAGLSHGPFLDARRERRAVASIAEKVDVRARTLAAPVRELSGGNQQKALFAKWLLELRASGNGARAPRFVIWGGETTVTLHAPSSGSKRKASTPAPAPPGGRCQELALAAARVLDEAGERARGISLLAAGTDGRDGPTDAAGACVNGTTWRAIRAAGCDPGDALAAHQSYSALQAIDAAVTDLFDADEPFARPAARKPLAIAPLLDDLAAAMR